MSKEEITNIFSPSFAIQKNVSKGLYMSSVISPDPRSKCASCGGTKFTSSVYDERFKLSIAKCSACGGMPDRLRIRRSLPIGLDGKAQRVEIRFNRIGERIKSVDEAMHIARSLDYDLRDGRFDPNDYRPKSMGVSFLFKNLISSKYLPYYQNKLAKGEISPGGLDTKKVMINHLKGYFDDFDIRKIKAADIKEFYMTFKGGDRSKDLSIQELRVFFNFCHEIELIKQIPTMPKTSQSKSKDVAIFLTEKEQEKVINSITDPFYKMMIETLAIYAMRPSELRALQWRDVNFHEGTLSIQRHFSKNILTPGRKSNEKILILPITERFAEIISSLPRSINGEDFIFQSKMGEGAVGEARLRKYWSAACKKAKINKKVTLYEGTKHSRLSHLKSLGHSDDQLILLTGHTKVETLQRYAQETSENKLKKVNKMINENIDWSERLH